MDCGMCSPPWIGGVGRISLQYLCGGIRHNLRMNLMDAEIAIRYLHCSIQPRVPPRRLPSDISTAPYNRGYPSHTIHKMSARCEWRLMVADCPTDRASSIDCPIH